MAESTSIFSIVLTLQPFSTNSTASQSSNSGCDGGAPIVPKSSLVSTRPRPYRASQRRLTITRAVSGLSRLTSQRARPRRFGGSSSDMAGSADGVLAYTRWPGDGERAAFTQRRRRPFVARLVLHHERRRQLEVLDRLLQPRHVLALGLERSTTARGTASRVPWPASPSARRAESRSRHACARSRRRRRAARPPSSWTGGSGPVPCPSVPSSCPIVDREDGATGEAHGRLRHQHELERHAPAVADRIDDPRLAEPRVRDRRIGRQGEQIAARHVAVALDRLEVDACSLRAGRWRARQRPARA